MNYSLKNYAEVKDDLREMPEGADVVEEYSKGFIGSYFDAEAEEEAADLVRADGFSFDMSDLAHEYGFASQAAGGTYLLFPEVEKCGIPTRLISRNSQPVGNCVSRGAQNALLHSLCVAATHGGDAVGQELIDACQFGVNPVSSEVLYWGKWPNRPGGDGWSAGSCLSYVKKYSGIVPRGDYHSIGGPDLRKETRSSTHAYGLAQIPDSMRTLMKKHPLESYARCRGFQEVADAISAGHAVHTDGGEAWPGTPNEDGVSRRRGHWSHSMCVVGVVATEEFKKKYRTQGGLVIQNSWANFNHISNQKVFGTNQKLPDGSFITTWEDASRRSFYAVSSVKGWPNRKLKNWAMRDLI